MVENEKMSHEKRAYTVIVGAGLSGLTAATQLVKAGKHCLLVERESKVGGLCRSFKMDDIVFDFGPHVLFIDPETEVGAYTRKVLAKEFCITRSFAMAIHAKGRYWRFPNHFDLWRYPWRYKKALIVSLLKRRKGLPPEILSAEEELTDKCGPEFYNDIFSRMLFKKTLLPGNLLHFHWLARVDRTAGNNKEPFRPQPRLKTLKNFLTRLRQPYLYPAEGIEALPNLLWAEYTQCGGTTLLNCGPVQLGTNSNRVELIQIKDRSYPVENLIWTAPINSLNSLLNVSTPPLRYISLVLIYLSYNCKLPVKRPFVYTYHLKEDQIFHRIYYPHSIFRQLSPPDREGLCLECALPEGVMNNASDQDLINQAVESVARLGLYKNAELRQSRCIRLQEVMPIYELNYEAQMEKAYDQVRNLRNVFAVGRQGGYYFCLTPGAIRQGLKVSKALLSS